MAKENKPKIDSVSYIYAGTNKEFDSFLKSVIKDYISDDKTVPDKKQEKQNVGRKTKCEYGCITDCQEMRIKNSIQ